MNFLAHAYLSGNNEKVLLGNFMGDFIKGKQYKDYEIAIAKGVLLHREIDQFTDNNKIVLQSKIRLRKAISHYAGVVVDIFYDHFLIHQWESFSTITLKNFISNIYNVVEKYDHLLPAAAKTMIPFMIEQDWLLGYGQIEGLTRSLRGISKRSRFHPPLIDTIPILQNDYASFEAEFMTFFPQLIRHVENIKQELGLTEDL